MTLMDLELNHTENNVRNSEGSFVELNDGRILFIYSRFRNSGTHDHCTADLAECIYDPASEFLSSESPMSMKRNPWTNELVAIWNDYDPRWGVAYREGSWSRTPLVMAYSKDEGKTWYGHTLLESEPNRGYCYTAMLFSAQWKDRVLPAYCRGADNGVLKDMKINHVRMKK